MARKAKKHVLFGGALIALGFVVFLDIALKPVKQADEGRIFTVVVE